MMLIESELVSLNVYHLSGGRFLKTYAKIRKLALGS